MDGEKLTSTDFSNNCGTNTHIYESAQIVLDYIQRNDFEVEQEYCSCELPNCTIHNSGIITLTITTSNDFVPFFIGTTRNYSFQYNMAK